ncbi:MAG: AraC family transcriptional regulator [Cyanobacteria bacterium P01_E01_bin.35]
MSLILNEEDWEKMCELTPKPQLNNLVLGDFEELWGMPEYLARGYDREIQLSHGVWLNFSDNKYHQDLKVKTPVHNHPFQMVMILSGSLNCTIHPTFSKVRSYFSGSGISPAYVDKFQTGQHIVSVNVEIEPAILESYLLSDAQFTSLQEQLFKGEDWKVSYYPKVTPAMRSLAYQMWNAPYRGAVKRIYLQAKVFELLVLYLDLLSEDPQQAKSTLKLKPKTVNALHHAKDILATQLEQPPSLSQLAQQVGISQRTLQRGFPALFNTTAMGYLTQQRLDRAEKLLREGKFLVSDVATMVGYGHFGQFSRAFKQRFGITPSQCLAGELSPFKKD